MKKINYLFLVLGMLSVLLFRVSADTLISSDKIFYRNTSLDSNNVQDTLDKLNTISDNKYCGYGYYKFFNPIGYTCLPISKDMVDTCPGCAFGFITDYFAYNRDGETNLLTDALISNDYRNLKKDGYNRNIFLGLVINNNSKVVGLYYCLLNDYNPYCLKPFEMKNNYDIIMKKGKWSGGCTLTEHTLRCSDKSGLSFYQDSDGIIEVGDYSSYCNMSPSSVVRCSDK